MGEVKNTNAEGQPSKKSLAGQKSPAKKPPKEQPKPAVQSKSPVSVGSSLSLLKKVDEVAEEIENAPLKSFEKREREKVSQSYEKLIFKLVREINSSRQ
ncbi:MAG TPA: hypothetical protein ACFYEK_03445 [Candidatus Wunengus sp. YC60]|uniref:hypothetical protein n=1 Tax=Candidatus Wunengus sp. YC60 TaxID=3367697 RepID=UPI004025154E